MEINKELTEQEFDKIYELCYHRNLGVNYDYIESVDRYIINYIYEDNNITIDSVVTLILSNLKRQDFKLIYYYRIVEVLMNLNYKNELDNIVDMIKLSSASTPETGKVNQLVVNRILISLEHNERSGFRAPDFYKTHKILRYLNKKNKLDEVIKLIKEIK